VSVVTPSSDMKTYVKLKLEPNNKALGVRLRKNAKKVKKRLLGTHACLYVLRSIVKYQACVIDAFTYCIHIHTHIRIYIHTYIHTFSVY